MKLKVFSQLDKNQTFFGLESAVNNFVESNPQIVVASVDTHKDGVMLVAVVKYDGDLMPVEKEAIKFAPAMPVILPPAPPVNENAAIGNIENG